MIGHKIASSAFRSSRGTEQQRAHDERSTVWAFVWTLFAFKVVTIGATFWAASGSTDAAFVLLATNWFWMAIPVVAVTGPLMFHHRLRKARRQRAAMMRSEWMLD